MKYVVVRTLSLSVGLFLYIIGDTRNTIMRYMACYLKSCRPGKAADLGTSESMLPLAGATERVLEEDVMPRRKREKTRSGEISFDGKI